MNPMSKVEATIRVAIVTDLHYDIEKDGGVPLPEVALRGTRIDPMAALNLFLEEEASEDPIDILLCPGDITTRAKKAAFDEGWNRLNNLKVVLGASHLIASTGNHEIASRAGDEHSLAGNVELAVEPLELLLSVNDYPAAFSDPLKKWVYWGRGYEIIEGDNWAVVIINSCHYHGSLLSNEYERGRISQAALRELEIDLEKIKDKYPFRLVLLHHPPVPQEGSQSASLGKIPMQNGEQLVSLLEKTCRDWIVIHGHKHFHRLIRAQGGATCAPIIFSAGSFGANLPGEIAQLTRNQFYILTLEAVKSPLGKPRIRGRFDSYFWDGFEWAHVYDMSKGLPHGCGFRWKNIDIEGIALQIQNHLEVNSLPYCNWEDLVSTIEDLRYLMPDNIQELKNALDYLNISYFSEKKTWFPSQLSMGKK